MIIKAVIGFVVAVWLSIIASGVGFAAGYLFPHSTSSTPVIALQGSATTAPQFDPDVQHRYVVESMKLAMAEKTAAQWRIYDVIEYQDHLFVDVQTAENEWWLLVYRWDGTVWKFQDILQQSTGTLG